MNHVWLTGSVYIMDSKYSMFQHKCYFVWHVILCIRWGRNGYKVVRTSHGQRDKADGFRVDMCICGNILWVFHLPKMDAIKPILFHRLFFQPLKLLNLINRFWINCMVVNKLQCKHMTPIVLALIDTCDTRVNHYSLSVCGHIDDVPV